MQDTKFNLVINHPDLGTVLTGLRVFNDHSLTLAYQCVGSKAFGRYSRACFCVSRGGLLWPLYQKIGGRWSPSFRNFDELCETTVSTCPWIG
jgi:hypothetical protein